MKIQLNTRVAMQEINEPRSQVLLSSSQGREKNLGTRLEMYQVKLELK